jgi:hypothetical protein
VSIGDRKLEFAGSTDLELGGLYNPLVAFDRSKDRETPLASRAVSAFGGAKVKDVYVGVRSAELTALRATFAGGTVAWPDSGYARLTLPRVPGAISSASLQLHRGKRTLPIVVPAPARETVETVLELPEKIEAAVLPTEASLTNAAGSLVRTVRRDGRKVTVRTQLTLAAPVVEPERYGDLRALFGALEADAGRTVLLRKKES